MTHTKPRQPRNAYVNKAIIRFDKGDLDAAIEEFQEVIRLKPDDVKLLASAYTSLGGPLVNTR